MLNFNFIFLIYTNIEKHLKIFLLGLDPAGPLFNIFEARLTSADARFVDIIHTDFGFYGIARNTGTVDFFPNGGHRVQPGCPKNFSFFSNEGTLLGLPKRIDDTLGRSACTLCTFSEFCSHHRSWRFYAESLIDESAFLAVQCPSFSRFSSGECNDNARIIMGYKTLNSMLVENLCL